MALESEKLRVSYAGNGSSTNFSFPWAFLDATDLDVYLVDQAGTVLGTPGAEFLKTFVTDYDVVGNYNPLTAANDDFTSGASINFTVAPLTGYTVVVIRNNPDTQDTSLTNNAAYQSSVIETAFDKIVMMVQFLVDRSSRSVRMTDANPQSFDPRLPNPIVADSTLAVDPTGVKIVMGPTVTNINTALTAAAASAAAAAVSATAAANSATNASASATAAASSATASAASATASATSAAASAASAVTSASAANAFNGSGKIAETSFTLANNQAAPANVVGLSFAGASVGSAEIDCHFYINTTGAGATEYSARCKYLATYKTTAAAWDLAPLGAGGDIESVSGQPAGIALSITSAGQVQYTSTNVTGTAGTSKMNFRASTMGV